MKDPVKVRIAFRINSIGDWTVAGWNGATAEEMIRQTGEMLDLPEDGTADAIERVYWVDFDAPLPRVHTIQGELADAED